MTGAAYRVLFPTTHSASTSSAWSLGTRGLGGLLKGFTPVRQVGEPRDTFGTIFELELSSFYAAHSEQRNTSKLVATLRGMQAAGIKTVVFSSSWKWAEPAEGQVRLDYVDWLMGCTCNNTNLKVDLILDVMHPPDWIWTRFHDAHAYDSHGRKYPGVLSWFHPASYEAGLRFMQRVASHLAEKYPGCAAAIQPVYNNEYEAKYTQEYDCYQDYSPYALVAFRNWIQQRQPDLAALNTRWGTAFKEWPEVAPPKLTAGGFTGADFSARFWDFLRFREEQGAEVFNRACETVKRAGLQCFHHFPEFFTVMDAIYSAPMFKRLASSPHTDFLIMDSNFRTPYGTVMNPHKLRIYVGAAQPYGKPVYFEAAVERFASMHLLEAGFKNAMLAGAANLGITNWHTRVEMTPALADTMRPAVPPKPGAKCKPTELIGLFLHLDSCAAFHGLQWQWERRDPLHDFVESLAERLSYDGCNTDVAVHIELDRFLAAVPTFTRAVFVEPLLLYDSGELASYVAVKAALKGLPTEVLRLPVNTTSGPALVVLQDLPGAAAVPATAGGGAAVGV